jgi:hypothetical protein
LNIEPQIFHGFKDFVHSLPDRDFLVFEFSTASDPREMSVLLHKVFDCFNAQVDIGGTIEDIIRCRFEKAPGTVSPGV